MFNKTVEIKHEGNFYDGFVGTVIEEYPDAVRVRIDFDDDDDEAMFFRTQVVLIK